MGHTGQLGASQDQLRALTLKHLLLLRLLIYKGNNFVYTFLYSIFLNLLDCIRWRYIYWENFEKKILGHWFMHSAQLSLYVNICNEIFNFTYDFFTTSLGQVFFGLKRTVGQILGVAWAISISRDMKTAVFWRENLHFCKI